MALPLLPAIMVIGGAAAMITSLVRPLGRGTEQWLNKRIPNELLQPPEMAQLKRRELVEDPRFYDELKRQGFNAERSGNIYDLSEKLLDIAELNILRLRGGIDVADYLTRSAKIGLSAENAEKIFTLTQQRLDPDTLTRAFLRDLPMLEGQKDHYDDLRQQGFSNDRIETIKKLAEILPPPQDIITWAAREVFEPELRTKFRLDEGLPSEYLEWAAKVGITGEVAKNYWAAHWVLPSITQIYEMWHREVIGEEDVDNFFVALDMNPYWRNHLKAISFRVFTRVDVRRMNKIGVLTEAETKRAYQDLGYAEDKAQKMMEFTLLYNEDPEEDEKTETDHRKDELKGLTRSVIIKSYKKGNLELEKAKTYLSDVGFADEVISFFILQADYENEEDREEALIKAYRRMYINGVNDFNTTSDLLDEMDIPAKQKERLVEIWDLEIIQKPALPSKTELIKFTKKRIINLDTFKEMMSNLGYSLRYVEWYIKDNKLAPAKE